MKTKISSLTVTECDDYGREEKVNLRIRTEVGEMMANRLIQLFSQYPPERLEYDPDLELEIVEGYMQKFCIGFSIITILQDDFVSGMFANAVYGFDDCREIQDEYAIFVQYAIRNMCTCMKGWLRQGVQTPISDITLNTFTQFFRDVRVNPENINVLLGELLKARRRIKKYVLRYIDEVEYHLFLA